jgi:hypothetical protein
MLSIPASTEGKRAVLLPAAALVTLTACYEDDPDKYGAEVMCEEFVEDRLKSPGSADFQRPTTTEVGTNTWLVSGSVDAQDGFGALVRVDYECTVRGDSDGLWTLIDMQHEQR